MTTRRNLATPNLPLAPREYGPRYQEQLNNVHRLFYNTVVNQINSPYVYGQFYTSLDTTGTYPTTATAGNLTNPVANDVNLVPFFNNVGSYGANIGAVNTRIYVTETGVYNVQFSAQCDTTTGGTNTTVYFWVRQNGADVPASAGKVLIAKPHAEVMAAWNWVLALQAGDYIELAWSSDDTHALLLLEAASAASPPRPAVPAVILTVVWASGLNYSLGLSQ